MISYIIDLFYSLNFWLTVIFLISTSYAGVKYRKICDEHDKRSLYMKTFDEFIKNIIFPKGIDIKLLNKSLYNDYRKQFLLHVIYSSSCNCDHDSFVLLDRWPMSESIIEKCDECKEYCLFKISDPVRFYVPGEDKELSIEEILGKTKSEKFNDEHFNQINQIFEAFNNGL